MSQPEEHETQKKPSVKQHYRKVGYGPRAYQEKPILYYDCPNCKYLPIKVAECGIRKNRYLPGLRMCQREKLFTDKGWMIDGQPQVEKSKEWIIKKAKKK